jgi:hypothetical protein
MKKVVVPGGTATFFSAGASPGAGIARRIDSSGAQVQFGR